MAVDRTDAGGEEPSGDEQGVTRKTDDQGQSSLQSQNREDDDQGVVGIEG